MKRNLLLVLAVVAVQTGQSAQIRQAIQIEDGTLYRRVTGAVSYYSKILDDACVFTSVRHLLLHSSKLTEMKQINSLLETPKELRGVKLEPCAKDPLEGLSDPPDRKKGVYRLRKRGGVFWIFWNPETKAYCQFKNVQSACDITDLPEDTIRAAPFLDFNPLKTNVDYQLICGS